MSVDEIKAMVMRYIYEPWHQGNVEIFDELCTPDYTSHDRIQNTISSREEMKKEILEIRAAYPDVKVTIDNLIMEGSLVAVDWTMNAMEEGKPKKAVGVTILHLRDGKIDKDHFVSDFVATEQPVS